ncbi:hypothetical protein CgIS1_00055 [Frankia sp. CgS1]|nr:hypothetical protein CgIS1_00055 [Frankia sp. CgIS1]
MVPRSWQDPGPRLLANDIAHRLTPVMLQSLVGIMRTWWWPTRRFVMVMLQSLVGIMRTWWWPTRRFVMIMLQSLVGIMRTRKSTRRWDGVS